MSPQELGVLGFFGSWKAYAAIGMIVTRQGSTWVIGTLPYNVIGLKETKNALYSEIFVEVAVVRCVNVTVKLSCLILLKYSIFSEILLMVIGSFKKDLHFLCPFRVKCPADEFTTSHLGKGKNHLQKAICECFRKKHKLSEAHGPLLEWRPKP